MVDCVSRSQAVLLGTSFLGKCRWEILGAKSLPRLPRSRTIPYLIKFIVWNDYDHLFRVKVQLESPSKVFVFRQITRKMKGKSRIKWTKDSLVKIIEHEIPSRQSKSFDFSALYRPHFARRLSPFLVLQYRIFGVGDAGKISLRSDPYRIEIPVEKGKSEVQGFDSHKEP